MGFFGLFKRKEEKALDQLMGRVFSEMFPRGEKDLARDAERIDALADGMIPTSELNGFVSGCKALLYISEDYDEARFVESVRRRANGRLSLAQSQLVFAYLEGEARYYDNLLRMFSGLVEDDPDGEDIFGEHPWIFSQGVTSIEIPGSFGEYGRCVTNPIPTVSVRASNHYLSRLYYSSNSVDVERRGSTKSEVTPGSIDIYEVSLSGKSLGTVYLCPYHKKTSTVPALGFSLV